MTSELNELASNRRLVCNYTVQAEGYSTPLERPPPPSPEPLIFIREQNDGVKGNGSKKSHVQVNGLHGMIGGNLYLFLLFGRMKVALEALPLPVFNGQYINYVADEQRHSPKVSF